MVNEPVANAPRDKGKEADAVPAKPQERSDAGEARPSKLNAEITDVTVDQRKMDALREHWMRAVRPHSAALREAAQAHYEVVAAMRAEQQRLIDEADRLQRSIDALEKEYQDLTTPRPALAQ
jgi:chromosome segregation ATPase